MNRLRDRMLLVLGLLACMSVGVSGCGDQSEGQGERQFINIGTAPIGGAFHPVGSEIAEAVNDHRGDLDWRVNAESTGGSMENIRLLSSDRMEFAMSNASITYFAVRGERDWGQAHEVRSVMTLFPNVAMFVTREDSGIRSISDLAGKTVFVGPEGAGFDNFIEPILEAHGVSFDQITPRYGSQQSAVDLLGDGAVDAAMIGGGVPTSVITQAAQAMDIYLVPYDEDAKQALMEQYEFFHPAVIPGGTYSGVDEDYHGLNVGSAHLITHASADEQMVYDFVRLVFENREQIAEGHRAARAITPENVVRDTGTPFHPGAIRYFEEAGIWPDSDGQAEDETGDEASADAAEGDAA